MGVNNNWRPVENMNDWMRDIEKRLIHEERRPIPLPAQDVVGPGFRPYATEVKDWNSDGPIVGGHFFSDANMVINSPDDTKHWMGIVQSNAVGQGLQRVWEFVNDTEAPSPDPVVYTRAFVTNEDGTRTYTAWAQGGGSGGGGAPTGPAGGDLTGTYPDPQIAPNAVGSAEIADGSVTNNDLAATGTKDNTTFLRGDGTWAVPPGSGGGAPSGPAGGSLTGTYPNPTLAANSVGASQITDGTVGNVELADNAVTLAKMADNSVGTAELVDGSVTSAKILDGTIVHGDVAAANKDGLAGIPSMRTLGSGAQQAAAGDHSHDLAGGGINGVLPITKGGTGAATATQARANLNVPGRFVGPIPALTAGVWTTLTHGLAWVGPLQIAFTYPSATGEAVELDWRKKDNNSIEIKADLAFAAAALDVTVVA